VFRNEAEAVTCKDSVVKKERVGQEAGTKTESVSFL
jgi:hypothetical protein